MDLTVVAAAAIFFYRAAKMDHSSPLWWTSLSIAVSLLMLACTKLGLFGIGIGQFGLLIGIIIYRVGFDKRSNNR